MYVQSGNFRSSLVLQPALRQSCLALVGGVVPSRCGDSSKTLTVGHLEPKSTMNWPRAVQRAGDLHGSPQVPTLPWSCIIAGDQVSCFEFATIFTNNTSESLAQLHCALGVRPAGAAVQRAVCCTCAPVDDAVSESSCQCRSFCYEVSCSI